QGTSVGHRDTPHSGVTQETHTDVPSNTRTSWRAEEGSKLPDFDAVMSTGKGTSRHREKSRTDCALNMPEYMHYTTRGNIAHGTGLCTGTPARPCQMGRAASLPAPLCVGEGPGGRKGAATAARHAFRWALQAGQRVSGEMVHPRSESVLSIARRLCRVSSLFALMTHQRAV